VPIVSDVRLALEALFCSLSPMKAASQRTRAWLERIDELGNSITSLNVPEEKGAIARIFLLFLFISYSGVLDSALRQLATGGVRHTMSRQPRMWAAPGTSTTLARHSDQQRRSGHDGFGLPAPLGVQVAHPGERGGSVWRGRCQHPDEHSGARHPVGSYQLPVKVVINQQRWQGWWRQWQESSKASAISDF